jgi:hypothetical protein
VDARVLLLLSAFPTAGYMFGELIRALSDFLRGHGTRPTEIDQSDSRSDGKFDCTFRALAEVTSGHEHESVRPRDSQT